LVCRYQGESQIMIDVRVHTRQRKLNPVDAGLIACFEKSLPG
jgi:hypothetical protein